MLLSEAITQMKMTAIPIFVKLISRIVFQTSLIAMSLTETANASGKTASAKLAGQEMKAIAEMGLLTLVKHVTEMPGGI